MRMMILSTLGLAALAVAIQCCPPLKARLTTVIFGTQAHVTTTASGSHLVAQAADKVKGGATSALERVEATAARLTGHGPPATPAPATDAPAPPPPTRAVQKNG